MEEDPKLLHLEDLFLVSFCNKLLRCNQIDKFTRIL